MFVHFTGGAPGGPSQPRLYCCSYAGGSAAIFAPWARVLSPDIAVIGVEQPGHGSRFREPLPRSVAEMADQLAAAITAAPADAPLAVYGHSLGAVVAFETTLRLQRPATRHLFVGAARAPHLPAAVPAISHLDDKAFLDAVQARYGGLPAALFEEPELLAMVLPVLRADFRAYEDYRYREGDRVHCPITAFHGADDPVVHRHLVAEWSRVAAGDFKMAEAAGDHFFLQSARDLLLGHFRMHLSGCARP